jgi:hypothetical protein
LGTLDQQIAFELRNCGEDRHGHPPRRAGEINPAQGQTMYSHVVRSEALNRSPNIHGVATKSIQLGHD